ncbi:MAG: cyclic nucleotide-binding domain-containing protein [Thiovulaceae bacterium]|nr:cyclic nucleotide-binding domain-containing protein [Sulfurimonadaceae bacterium]
MPDNIDKLLKITHRLDFFDTMSDRERLEVLKRLDANIIKYPKGTKIISAEAIDLNIYFVLSGLVSIQKNETVNSALNLIKPGSFFGEMAFITRTTSGVSVIANEDTAVLSMSNKEIKLLNILIREKIKDKIIFSLAKKLRFMNEMVNKMDEENH